MLQFELYEWPEIEPLCALGAAISKDATTIRVDWFGDSFSAHASYNELYFQDAGRCEDLEIHYDFETLKRRVIIAIDLRLNYAGRVDLSALPEKIIDYAPHILLLPVGMNADSKLAHRMTGNIIGNNIRNDEHLRKWAKNMHAEISRAVIELLPQPIAEEITPLLDWYMYVEKPKGPFYTR